MRYLMLLHGNQPPTPPPPDLMEAIMKLGEEATRAGVLLDTQGLAPSGAGGVRVELRDAIALLAKLTGRPALTAPGSAPAGEMAHTYADTTRTVALLGWRPKTSLADGLQEEVRWIEAMERTGELDAA